MMKKNLVIFSVILLFLTQCSATASKRSFGEVVDDNVINMKLRSKLMKDRVVKSHDIKLKVWKGVVTMNGVMEDQSQINRAIEIAEQQRGVKEVRAYLVLNSQNDQEIQTKKKKPFAFLPKIKKNKNPQNDPVFETDLSEEDSKNTSLSKSEDQNEEPYVRKKKKNNKQDQDYKEFEY